jgi:uncharacterized membrane protein YhiD involved in acid resistance
VTAAIGLLVGSGFWLIGIGATVLVMAIINLPTVFGVTTSDAISEPPSEST